MLQRRKGSKTNQRGEKKGEHIRYLLNWTCDWEMRFRDYNVGFSFIIKKKIDHTHNNYHLCPNDPIKLPLISQSSLPTIPGESSTSLIYNPSSYTLNYTA